MSIGISRKEYNELERFSCVLRNRDLHLEILDRRKKEGVKKRRILYIRKANL